MTAYLYKDEEHRCVEFSDLIMGDQGIQANQFMIINNEEGAVLDPGGLISHAALTAQIERQPTCKKLIYVIASHQDPDIVGSTERWLVNTKVKFVISGLWKRFIPHLVSRVAQNQFLDRIIAVPDRGMRIPLGESELYLLPSHFLHSVGNICTYDPVSKILFSADIGASVGADHAGQPVEDFKAHTLTMEGFHKRYMVNKRVLNLWVNMVRTLDVEQIVPQHGKRFVGKPMVNAFLDWLCTLECGTDLVTQALYRVPEK